MGMLQTCKFPNTTHNKVVLYLVASSYFYAIIQSFSATANFKNRVDTRLEASYGTLLAQFKACRSIADLKKGVLCRAAQNALCTWATMLYSSSLSGFKL